jgi:hypothetical protein
MGLTQLRTQIRPRSSRSNSHPSFKSVRKRLTDFPRGLEHQSDSLAGPTTMRSKHDGFEVEGEVLDLPQLTCTNDEPKR